MKKPKEYEDQSFFKEHLKQTGEELYEWSLILYYYWHSDIKHHINVEASASDDDNSYYDIPTMVLLCEKCQKPLLESGNFIQSIAHDPKIDFFPPKFDDLLRSSIQRAFEADFQANCLSIILFFISEGGEPFFSDDPCKEFAVIYFHVTSEEREKIELNAINTFCFLAFETRLLSILYNNFSEFRKVLEISVSDLYDTLSAIQKDVIRDCYEITGYWKLRDETKKKYANSGRKGGSVKTSSEDILESIKSKLEQSHEKLKSAKDFWRLYQREHYGEEKADEYGVYFQEDYSGLDCHALADSEGKAIKFGTFRSYLNKAKKNTQGQN